MLKVGDKVTIRVDLEAGKFYGEEECVEDMVQYRGKNAIIDGFTGVRNNVYINIDNEDWAWSPEMFEGVI